MPTLYLFMLHGFRGTSKAPCDAVNASLSPQPYCGRQKDGSPPKMSTCPEPVNMLDHRAKEN